MSPGGREKPTEKWMKSNPANSGVDAAFDKKLQMLTVLHQVPYRKLPDYNTGRVKKQICSQLGATSSMPDYTYSTAVWTRS